jgi:hypothetical protein
MLVHGFATLEIEIMESFDEGITEDINPRGFGCRPCILISMVLFLTASIYSFPFCKYS